MIYNRSLNVIEKVHDLFQVFSVLAHIRILSKWIDTKSRASLCGTLGWNIFLGLLCFSTSSLGDVPSPSARSWSSVHLLLSLLLYYYIIIIIIIIIIQVRGLGAPCTFYYHYYYTIILSLLLSLLLSKCAVLELRAPLKPLLFIMIRSLHFGCKQLLFENNREIYDKIRELFNCFP